MVRSNDAPSRALRQISMGLCAVVASACLSPELQAQSRTATPPDEVTFQSPDQPAGQATSVRPVVIQPDWAAVDDALEGGRIANADQLGQRTQTTRQSAVFMDKMNVWRDQVEETNVVMLFPALAFSADQTALVKGKTFYSFTADIEDSRHINIIGACSGIEPPADSTLANSIREDRATRKTLSRLALPYRISHEEYGYTLNFSGFGCGYEITLICKSACDPEAELTAIANDLFIFNQR